MTNLTDQLRTLAPGDVVYFACGGKTKVLGLPYFDSSNDKFYLNPEDQGGSIYYKMTGKCYAHSLLDIIRVEKAFRWEDVKPGMGFICIGSLTPIFYIGPDLNEIESVVVENNDGFSSYPKRILTRHPELDRSVLC